jgi:hypothetical protein
MKEQTISRSLAASNRNEPAAAKAAQQSRTRVWGGAQSSQSRIDNHSDSAAGWKTALLSLHPGSGRNQDELSKKNRQKTLSESAFALKPIGH